MSENSAIRVLDAAANRAVEGMRVVEDFARFVLDDAYLTHLLKSLRHDLAEAVLTEMGETRQALRETQVDVGTSIAVPSESHRSDSYDVCSASCERVKQSLRSLEEYGKTVSQHFASRCEVLRYRWYTLEKALALTHHSRQRLSEANLCVLIDGGTTLEEFEIFAQQLIEAGVPMIQLRDKQLCDRELIERANTLCKLAHRARVPSQGDTARSERATLVILNDRADVAAATNADGVHLGQDDLPVKAAREILGAHKLIGVSTHNIEQARAAVLTGANYLGVGPTFPSHTKAFAEFAGAEFLQQVAAEITLPAFAIGGIGLENLNIVLNTGIQRVAVSEAVAAATDPAKAARSLRQALATSQSSH